MNRLMTRIIILSFLSALLAGMSLWSDVRACDTWVALPEAAAAGATILAKNSDRPLFDCQPLVFHPRQKWPDGAVIDLGRLAVPQVQETFATLGSSPYWCWGYEEGINEHGVAIGNEGIWTRALAESLAAHAAGEAPALGPTGMDMIRLGLERSRTAREAVDVIAGLTEQYGQFGSGLPAAGVEGAYDNSYIIADPREAWLLETAGRHWVAKRYESGVASISNAACVRADWDLSSPGLAGHAADRGWWPGGGGGDPIDFSAAFGDDSPVNQARAERAQVRAARSRELLDEKKGGVDVRWMMRIARDRATAPSIDLDMTASSCVAVLPGGDKSLPVFWWCPAVPSRSCYVPFFVHGSGLPKIVSIAGTFGKKIVPPSSAGMDAFSGASYWWLMRDLFEKSVAGTKNRLDEIRAAFDPLEREFADGLPEVIQKALALRRAGSGDEAARVLDAYSAACVDKVIAKIAELCDRLAKDEGGEIPEKYRPFVGRYGDAAQGKVLTVLVRNGRLAVDIPGQTVFELNDPDGGGGRWTFVLTDQAAVSFELSATKGRGGADTARAMTIHQGGVEIEFVREEAAPQTE